MAHAAQNLRVVALDLHAPAATVAPLPPLKLAVYSFDINGEARGQSLDDRDQRASVRLSGCCEAEHPVTQTFGRKSGVKKARTHFGRRQHPRVVLAEHTVAVAREEIIEVITQRLRYDVGGKECLPEAAQIRNDFERRVRADENALQVSAVRVLDEDDRVNAAQRRVSLDDRAPVVALKRGETHRSEERRVGKEWRTRWSPTH